MFVRITAVMKKEVLHIIRDPRSLAMAIAVPLIFLFLFSYAINFDINNVNMSVCDMDKTRESREYVAAFTSNGYFTLVRSTDRQEDILKSLDRSESRIGVIIPAGFAKELGKGREVKVQVLVDGVEANSAKIVIGYTLGASYLYSSKVMLEFFNRIGFTAVKKAVGINGIPHAVYNTEMKSRNFIIPGLIAVIMSMILSILTSLTVVREKERGTFEQLIVTPVKPYELILGKIIPYWVIGIMDMWLVVLVGTLFYKVPLNGSLLFLFFTAGIFSVCGLGIGLFVSTAVESQQVANQLSMLLSYLPAFILSGFLFPVKSMPEIIQLITVFIPAKYFLVILRGIFLKGTGIEILFKETLVLFLFGALLIGAASARFKKKLT